MAQLIDKSALVAEIERILDNSEEVHNNQYILLCNHFKHFIDTLEVKEVGEDTKSVFEGQYLSKDKVVTTIERLQDECEEHDDNNGVELLEKLFNKLDTLVVEEVDLEKHLKEDIEDVLFDLNGVAVKGATHYLTVEDVKDIAKHFYELGLKVAQKGEEV